MTKIYLVTQGSYSDYRIVGAFSSEENANKVVEALKTGNSWDEAGVEVYDVDSIQTKEGHRNYCVWMQAGGDSNVYAGDGVQSPGSDSEQFSRSYTKGAPSGALLRVSRYVQSEEAAVKIANELRVRWLAEKPWPVLEPYGRQPYDFNWVTPEEPQRPKVKKLAAGEAIPPVKPKE